VVARIAGQVSIEKNKLIVWEEKEEREYPVAAFARVLTENGEKVHAGQADDGALNPRTCSGSSGRRLYSSTW
jgi:hypothetical protein